MLNKSCSYRRRGNSNSFCYLANFSFLAKHFFCLFKIPGGRIVPKVIGRYAAPVKYCSYRTPANAVLFSNFSQRPAGFAKFYCLIKRPFTRAGHQVINRIDELGGGL